MKVTKPLKPAPHRGLRLQMCCLLLLQIITEPQEKWGEHRLILDQMQYECFCVGIRFLVALPEPRRHMLQISYTLRRMSTRRQHYHRFSFNSETKTQFLDSTEVLKATCRRWRLHSSSNLIHSAVIICHSRHHRTL